MDISLQLSMLYGYPVGYPWISMDIHPCIDLLWVLDAGWAVGGSPLLFQKFIGSARFSEVILKMMEGRWATLKRPRGFAPDFIPLWELLTTKPCYKIIVVAGIISITRCGRGTAPSPRSRLHQPQTSSKRERTLREDWSRQLEASATLGGRYAHESCR